MKLKLILSYYGDFCHQGRGTEIAQKVSLETFIGSSKLLFATNDNQIRRMLVPRTIPSCPQAYQMRNTFASAETKISLILLKKNLTVCNVSTPTSWQSTAERHITIEQELDHCRRFQQPLTYMALQSDHNSSITL
jgi:hypothetical protein